MIPITKLAHRADGKEKERESCELLLLFKKNKNTMAVPFFLSPLVE